jgi:hypothetical protein
MRAPRRAGSHPQSPPPRTVVPPASVPASNGTEHAPLSHSPAPPPIGWPQAAPPSASLYREQSFVPTAQAGSHRKTPGPGICGGLWTVFLDPRREREALTVKRLPAPLLRSCGMRRSRTQPNNRLMRRKTSDQTGYFWIRRWNTVPGEGRNLLSIRRVIPPALQSQAGLGNLDHRLTTETPSVNVDKGGQRWAKVIVFVDLFDCYLRSGRRGRRFESCHSDQ